jgi:hypothetical protein
VRDTSCAGLHLSVDDAQAPVASTSCNSERSAVWHFCHVGQSAPPDVALWSPTPLIALTEMPDMVSVENQKLREELDRLRNQVRLHAGAGPVLPTRYNHCCFCLPLPSHETRRMQHVEAACSVRNCCAVFPTPVLNANNIVWHHVGVGDSVEAAATRQPGTAGTGVCAPAHSTRLWAQAWECTATNWGLQPSRMLMIK